MPREPDTKLYCTKCGREMDRRPECPFCGATSDYWDVEASHLSREYPVAVQPRPADGRSAGDGDLPGLPCESESISSPDQGDGRTTFRTWSEVLGEPEAGRGDEDGNNQNPARGEREANQGAAERSTLALVSDVSSRVGGGTLELPLDEKETPPLGQLVREEKDGSKTVFCLRVGESRVGSAPGNEIVLEDAYVSALHSVIICNLEGEKPVVRISDCKSRNRTFVNGQEITRSQLKDGDRVKFGRVELTLQMLR